MSADVVGYSRLMGQDETGTLQRLRTIRNDIVDRLVSDHGGRIVKGTGDGVLCEFPSSAGAVNCAIDIQNAVTKSMQDQPEDAQLLLRIGINLGDVVFEDGDIFGDGVNVAARLEQIADPNCIYLSGTARETLTRDLASKFEDIGEQELKNIGRPVRIWRWRNPVLTGSQNEHPKSQAKDEASQPTVAVIPFANLSSDRELDFLADGLAEDIITLIAKTPGFLVIGRYSTLTYRGTGIDVRKVGNELGVRYVVEGTIRPIGDKLRITVKLLDASSGSQIWSERFDRNFDDLLQVQDEVSAGIVARLNPEISRAEVQLAERYRPKDFSSWTLYRRAGTALFREGWNKRGFDDAARLYREAIARDPEFALAHAALSLTLAIGHILGHISDPDEASAEAERALQLTSNDSEVLGFAGCAIADLGDADRGIDILEQAIELNPSNPQAWTALGAAYLTKGDNERAVEKLRHGIRISPRDPRLAVWCSMLAQALAALGLIEEGIAEAKAACRRDQKLYNPRVVLAMLLLRAGQRDAAITALSDARRIEPDLDARAVAGLVGRRAAKALDEIWDSAISGT